MMDKHVNFYFQSLLSTIIYVFDILFNLPESRKLRKILPGFSTARRRAILFPGPGPGPRTRTQDQISVIVGELLKWSMLRKTFKHRLNIKIDITFYTYTNF